MKLTLFSRQFLGAEPPQVRRNTYEKEDIKISLLFTSLVLCSIFVSPLIVFAETTEHIHNDSCQHNYTDDIDNYLEQLNAGLIILTNTTITTFDNESIIMPFGDLSTPGKCSNILGHSWGNWGSWSEVSRLHFPNSSSSNCMATIRRWHFCERTYCSASQSETDYTWVVCKH